MACIITSAMPITILCKISLFCYNKKSSCNKITCYKTEMCRGGTTFYTLESASDKFFKDSTLWTKTVYIETEHPCEKSVLSKYKGIFYTFTGNGLFPR